MPGGTCLFPSLCVGRDLKKRDLERGELQVDHLIHTQHLTWSRWEGYQMIMMSSDGFHGPCMITTQKFWIGWIGLGWGGSRGGEESLKKNKNEHINLIQVVYLQVTLWSCHVVCASGIASKRSLQILCFLGKSLLQTLACQCSVHTALIGDKSFGSSRIRVLYFSSNNTQCFFFFFSWGQTSWRPKKVEVPMMQRTFFEGKNGHKG